MFGLANEQTQDPESGFHLPGTHAAHGLQSGPVCPATHWNCIDKELPAGNLEDEGQFEAVAWDVAPVLVM